MQVTQEHVHIDGILQNYYDGQAFKNNDLFREHKDGIQLILYYDEVEVCNLLGSKRKIHKLGKCACMHTNNVMLIYKACVYIMSSSCIQAFSTTLLEICQLK